MTANTYEFNRSFVADRDPSGSELRASTMLPEAASPSFSRRAVLLATLAFLILLVDILRIMML